ncbi:GNAT family N-acetyltransferase [Bacillus pinisoli]|uniref:GNAT family N-acetyltransferase n=1 Tax=Bacillus pinisoli TaxID=2901866 RepID=UPI001FF6D7C2|nr:GNAT family protein [Bacillus pinisoli]
MEIVTERLLLVPCSLDLTKSLVLYRKELEKRSPIKIPQDWPSSQLIGMLPFYIEQLESDQEEYGWGIWMIIMYEEKRIIGDFMMRGKPKNGVVEFSYHLVRNINDEGLAFEAVEAMMDWLIEVHDVHSFLTECEVQDHKAIRLFERLGMKCTSKDGEFLYWELHYADNE